jgi:mitogen-activated protein kinase 1/3
MKKLIRTDVMLGPAHINTLLYNLLVGLKYIHSAGVYHRDLKPANCLVNQDCSVKICDFGLARAVGRTRGLEALRRCDVDGSYGVDTEDADGVPIPGGPVVPSTLTKKRQMTAHVVTRWYRAPELILLQHGYTEAIDIWSIGCIFAELMQMQEEAIRFTDRGPLFPGSSCFPLSPDRRRSANGKKRGKNDQLEMIFSVIGTPAEADIDCLEKEDAKRYVRSFPSEKGEGIAERYPSVSAEALDLLRKMLTFSPKERCTVAQALAHPLLASVREPVRERTAEAYVDLGFDDEGDITEEDLRSFFGSELRKWRESQC